jgi:hydroxyacylglutathione hydrolase
MLKISPIPAFDDNYIWLLQGETGNSAVVVDPGDEAPVLAALQQQHLTLEAILITHKHGDHVGGVNGLKAAWPDAVVYGPAHEQIPAIDRPLNQGERVRLTGIDAEFEVMEVPGHTEGHLAYYAERPGVLFCGDTLFAGGCGRVFSGTYQQLHESLQRIAALPTDTAIYCAHEYTLANLGFARWVEPDSAAVAARLQAAEAQREAGLPTVPATLGLELQTNPFLRVAEPAVVAAAERFAGHALTPGAAVFTAIRNWKDREYD